VTVIFQMISKLQRTSATVCQFELSKYFLSLVRFTHATDEEMACNAVVWSHNSHLSGIM